jgi:hypothetical protein
MVIQAEPVVKAIERAVASSQQSASRKKIKSKIKLERAN